MKNLTALLLFSCFIAYSCDDKQINKIYCQGEVIEEKLYNVETGKTSYRMYLACAGNCKDEKPCDSIVKNYDSPLPGGVVREVWCGCKGEQSPQGCEVILQTLRLPGDTVIRQAKCTPRDNSCPNPGDSCLPRYKDLRDTIRSVFTEKDSIYRQRWITTCECLNRSAS